MCIETIRADKDIKSFYLMGKFLHQLLYHFKGKQESFVLWMRLHFPAALRQSHNVCVITADPGLKIWANELFFHPRLVAEE